MSATLTLPRLTARNAAEARVQLADRRARLLAYASDMLDRAELFTDTPEVCDELMAAARDALAQAERCGR